MGKYKLTKFGKVVVTLGITLLILATAYIISNAYGLNEACGTTQTEYCEVQVAPGDTLWTIAKTNCKDDVDIRDYIYKICQINNTNAKNIVPGQILHVPVEI